MDFTGASYSLHMPEWLVFLCTLCASAEGLLELAAEKTSNPVAAACITTVLGDTWCRFAVMGGREGMPRSLGSVYGGSVTRFLGGFRGGGFRNLTSLFAKSYGSGAVTSDGSALLVPDSAGSHAVHILCVHTGAILQAVGDYGTGPLQFRTPCQVCVASDGFVFVANYHSSRIEILTPRYDFHSFMGLGQLLTPFVADSRNHRVSLWTLEGEFVRHVGVGTLKDPTSVACSNADELVVADWQNKRVVVFNANGEIVWTSETSAAAEYTGVTLHGSKIYAQTVDGRCVVFT